MIKDTLLAKFTAISLQVSHASMLSVSSGYCQRALVDESEVIRIRGRTMDQ
jgi:hypothetical protein